MRSNGTLLRASMLFVMAMTMQSAVAQQTANVDSSSKSYGNECQAPVVISGAVTSPGRFELRRRVRLNELIASAGGVTVRAKGNIEIRHTVSNANCEKDAPADLRQLPLETPETYKFDEMLRGNDQANPYLRPGDIVTVGESELVYVVGRVVAPQALFLREEMTLTRALAMVGGVLRNAKTERIVIYRRHDLDTLKIIHVNLKDVKKDRRRDIVLQPYDIIEVASKNGDGQRIPGPMILPAALPKASVDGWRIIY